VPPLIKGYRFPRPPARIRRLYLRQKSAKPATSNHPPAASDNWPLQHIFLCTRLLILPMDEPPTKASHCTAVPYPRQRLARQTTHRRPWLRRKFPTDNRLACCSLGPLALPHHILDARILTDPTKRHSECTQHCPACLPLSMLRCPVLQRLADLRECTAA